jgi:hypothetical protein
LVSHLKNRIFFRVLQAGREGEGEVTGGWGKSSQHKRDFTVSIHHNIILK